jgi:hypothetical protein
VKRWEVFVGALMLGVGVYYASNMLLLLARGAGLLGESFALRGAFFTLAADVLLAWVLSTVGSAVMVDGLRRASWQEGEPV